MERSGAHQMEWDGMRAGSGDQAEGLPASKACGVGVDETE